MKKKKGNVLIALLVIVIIVILAIGVFMYMQKTESDKQIAELENNVSKLQETINNLQGNIVKGDNNEKFEEESNVPNSDLVVSTNDLYAYIENGILYYTEEVTNGNYSKDKMIKDTQLSNIERIKLYNIGTAVNPVLFFITADGQVYIMRYHLSKEIEKYEGLKDYKVEDILSHTGEMYDVFEVLLKDGTRKTVNVYENGETEEVKGVEKIDPNKELVYTEYSKYSSEYSISIPKINMNSQDVININNEIEKIINDVKTEIQQDTGLSGTIEYTSYINDDVLSVVILSGINSNYEWYDVYNVNMKTGKKCSNEELIALKGFTSSEFLDKLPELYENKFKELHSHLEDEERNSSYYMERYNLTISEENYSMDEPMFLDDNGNINVVAKIYHVAGGEPPHQEIIIIK